MVTRLQEETVMHAEPQGISIRFAGPADSEDVRRLALLDSAARSEGDTLVAEVDGRIRAALPLAQSRVIADPFEPSAEVASLLRLRAAQLDSEREPAGRHPLRALAHAMPVRWRHA
jgi:hypothetical protein